MRTKIIKYEDWILKEHYKWIDNHVFINEKLSGTTEFLKKLFNRIENLSNESKKKILKYGLSTLLLTTPVQSVVKSINNEPHIKAGLENVLGNELTNILQKNKFKKVNNLKLNSEGLNHIKYEEGDPKHHGEPILTAYELGDGRITVGWGHAELKDTSKFKLGQKITREEAEKLLQKDIQKNADGVRRIFKQWESEGLDVKITQEMFNALVSMSFNLGTTGLRTSPIIQEIKNKNFKKAGEMIKYVPNKKKFSGLISRRERESKMFLTGIKGIKNQFS